MLKDKRHVAKVKRQKLKVCKTKKSVIARNVEKRNDEAMTELLNVHRTLQADILFIPYSLK